MAPLHLAIPVFLIVLLCVGLSEQRAATVVESLHISTDIKYRFATTRVSSTISNPSHLTREVSMDVILPESAFIADFVMDVEGKEYKGLVEEKESAKRKYLKAKKEGESAGHLAARPRDTNRFVVQVNIKAMKKVSFNLTYQEVLKRKRGYYDQTLYVNPGEPVSDLRVDVNILESRPITFLKVPPIRDDLLTSVNLTANNPHAYIIKNNNQSAHITFRPTIDQQTENNPWGISGMFSVLYDIERDFDAGDVLIIDGYFVHFFAPKLNFPLPKDILFILDTSVSMDFGKLDQLKAAMKIILSELRPGDRFNILDFNTYSEFWNNEDMVPVTDANLVKAVQQIENLQTKGATDINEAMLKGVNFLYEHASEHNRSVIVFLTDGRSTVGETKDTLILENIRDSNRYHIPIYTLAFGVYADWQLMKKIAVQNDGFARRIYEEADSALQIKGFYDEVSTSMITDLNFDYLDDSVEGITDSDFSNYFNGSEILVAGKLINGSLESLPIHIRGNTSQGLIELELEAHVRRQQEIENFKDITEKMWAYLKIQDILRNREGAIEEEEREALKKQAVDMSIQYNFVTPVTSMVVTKPGDDRQQQQQRDVVSTHEGEGFNVGTFGGWRNRGRVGRDPHFMVDIVGLEVPVCFDVKGKENDVFQLIKDPEIDLSVNIKLTVGKKTDKHGYKRRFIKASSVLYGNITILAKLDRIVINTRSYKWDSYKVLHLGDAMAKIGPGVEVLTIRLKSGVRILIQKHKHWYGDDDGDDFLNVEVDKDNRLSKQSSGILGLFLHKTITATEYTFNGRKSATLRMKVNGRLEEDSARLVERHDPTFNATAPCWSLPEHGHIQSAVQSYHKKFLRSK
ncbi:inter-alpha-trypsin inhibitor heavy chain H3 [Patella vulgata]|uniref:inter-alpha-trypsin inhibitor heavy chain H3 n=1 Tax=Patella vulgata TaxID=6465 RepID=UPI00217FA954|nr:inter-alpha-trypsin inhibitor heavy chain H3 [Patella vulgata]